MQIHPWWQGFGEAVPPDAALPPRAAALIEALRAGIAGARLLEVKRCPATGIVAVSLDIEVERPQQLAHPIARSEHLAVLDIEGGLQPTVLALRADFPPDIPHQNDVPEGTPCALCIDDRPWAEAKLTWTAIDTVRRIQLWLMKAARGELHDIARPLDPIFFRSPVSLVIPRTALEPGSGEKELVGFIHDDCRVVIARPLSSLGSFVPDKGRMLVLAFRVNEQPMRRLRQAPMTLARLAEEMEKCGTNLVEELQRYTGQLAALGGERVRQLHSTVALIVSFPIANEGGTAVDDRRAFITIQTAGEIGVALGSLLPDTTRSSAKKGYVKAIGGKHKFSLSALDIQPAELHLAIDRTLAAATAGWPADTRKAVLIGAGSLGSQLALGLAREGCFAWTVIDDDRLLPHNLARHGLLPDAAGIRDAVDANAGSIRICTISSEGEVTCIKRSASAVTRKQLGAWTLIYDATMLDGLAAMRASHLPRETGGVLLGIVDMSRRSIHLVAGLPPPADSVGSELGFERGVAELAGTVNRAVEASLHQNSLRRRVALAPAACLRMPSIIDLAQVAWLRRELAQEGLPAVMAIAADHDQFTFLLAEAADAGSAGMLACAWPRLQFDETGACTNLETEVIAPLSSFAKIRRCASDSDRLPARIRGG